MIENYKSIGVLRIMLHMLAVGFMLVLPFAKHMWHPQTTQELIMGAIVPATAPIVFIIIMFDILMSTVMKSDAEEEQAFVLARIIKWHLLVGFCLLGMWLLIFTDSLFL